MTQFDWLMLLLYKLLSTLLLAIWFKAYMDIVYYQDYRDSAFMFLIDSLLMFIFIYIYGFLNVIFAKISTILYVSGILTDHNNIFFNLMAIFVYYKILFPTYDFLKEVRAFFEQEMDWFIEDTDFVLVILLTVVAMSSFDIFLEL